MDEFTPKQAADFLEISAETLKKYALLLEQNGHNVHRNGRNHRIYNGTDLALIKAMIVLNRDKSVNLEQAASIVTSTDTDITKILGEKEHNGTENGTHNTVPTVTTLQETAWMELYNGFITELSGLKSENEALKQLIIEQQEFHVKQQEQHSQEVEKIATRLEEQNQLIHELKNELSQLKESQQPKLSFWQRLFGK